MKTSIKITAAALTALCALPLASCGIKTKHVKLSGEVSTVTNEIARGQYSVKIDDVDFYWGSDTHLSVNVGYDATKPSSVSVTAPSDVYDYGFTVSVDEEGKTINISADKLTAFKAGTMTIAINADVKDLEVKSVARVTVDASGMSIIGDKSYSIGSAGIFTMGDIACTNVEFNFSGATNFDIGRVTASAVKVGASGASNGEIGAVVSTNGTDIDASGASEVTVNSLTVANSDVNASGASTVTANNFACVGKIAVDASGASTINITGAAKSIDATASGASGVNAQAAAFDTATVDLSGASEAKLTVASLVSGKATGASTLHISGKCEVSVSTSGGSAIKRS